MTKYETVHPIVSGLKCAKRRLVDLSEIVWDRKGNLYHEEISEDNKYKYSKLLGEGTFGKVHLYELGDDAIVIKEFNRPDDNELKILDRLESEDLLDECKLVNARIVKRNGKESVLMNAMSGTLFDLKGKHFSVIVGTFFNLVSGAYCLHQHGYAYIDYKLENILYRCLPGAKDKIEVVYGDLGSIFGLGDIKRTNTFPPFELRDEYRGKPVSMRYRKINEKHAVWGLGIVLFELLLGDEVEVLGHWDIKPQEIDVMGIVSRLFERYKYHICAISRDGKKLYSVLELMTMMLNPNPEERIDIESLYSITVHVPRHLSGIKFTDHGYELEI